MTVYAAPGAAGAKIAYKARYDNFIGGRFVPPVKEQYFDVVTPISGKVYTRAARSTAEDIELALDAAITQAQAATRHYAKRQVTWFSRQFIAEYIINEKLSEHNIQKFIPLIIRLFLTEGF